MILLTAGLLLSACCPFASRLCATETCPTLDKSELGAARPSFVCGKLYLTGQPSGDDFQKAKQEGIATVINLRTAEEVSWDPGKSVRSAGMKYVHIPFRAPETLTKEVFDEVRKLLKQEHEKPALLYCSSANRVAATWLPYRVLDQGVPLDQAVDEAKQIGLRVPEYLERAKLYIAEHQR
jgi:uncharacterized protein (TIGR01244 family)